MGQSSRRCNLQLIAGDCRDYAPERYVQGGKIRIRKLPEDSLVATLKIDPWENASVTIKLPASKYAIVYTNNFGQKRVRYVRLSRGVDTSIMLCQDSLVAYPKNTLRLLKEGEGITIDYSYSGCFSGDSLELSVVRKGNDIIARLYGNKQAPDRRSVLHHIVIDHKALTPSDVAAFARLENELPLVTGVFGCTNSFTYVIKSKYWNLISRNSYCGWNGFECLRAAWFGK